MRELIRVCRSDAGDGGWSIHPADATDAEIASGQSLALLSGTSRKVVGQWVRPTYREMVKALEILRQRDA